ncbi:DUF1579 family protein [Rhodanobacter sp. DHB23]|uniref:DUF1579 family protein n=1 Tax=Rhodanobacter sp. DHB23 TaxID=2775923 RepID=UPI001783ACAC|nr:DUF1579 family protein [Rhodanobacter sp. DHB23]MBD8872507.1 DUF1579 family protein [Rhodanobacter sp. DHB23]
MRQRSLFRSLSAFIAMVAITGAAPFAAVAQQPAPAAHGLNWLVGNWNVRQSFWSDAAKAPAIDTGSAVFTSVLEGRHLRQDLAIASAKPFHGLGYLGYDDAASRYDSLWMDVNFGGVVIAHGDCSADGRNCTFRGAMSGAHGGAPVPVREVLEASDADHFSYAYYERHDGKEMLTVRLEYSRTK